MQIIKWQVKKKENAKYAYLITYTVFHAYACIYIHVSANVWF